MSIARKFVIFFMIPAMALWSSFSLLASFALFELVRDHRFPLMVLAFTLNAFSCLFAWSCTMLNVRSSHLLIGEFSISSAVCFLVGWHTTSATLNKDPSGFFTAMAVAALVLPLMVVGGFVFLRLTRPHVAPDEPGELERSWFHVFVDSCTDYGCVLWLLTACLRLLMLDLGLNDFVMLSFGSLALSVVGVLVGFVCRQRKIQLVIVTVALGVWSLLIDCGRWLLFATEVSDEYGMLLCVALFAAITGVAGFVFAMREKGKSVHRSVEEQECAG